LCYSNGMVRPKKDSADRLDIIRSIRLTRAEWLLVQRAAKAKGLKPVAWLRATAVRAARRTEKR